MITFSHRPPELHVTVAQFKTTSSLPAHNVDIKEISRLKVYLKFHWVIYFTPGKSYENTS